MEVNSSKVVYSKVWFVMSPLSQNKFSDVFCPSMFFSPTGWLEWTWPIGWPEQPCVKEGTAGLCGGTWACRPVHLPGLPREQEINSDCVGAIMFLVIYYNYWHHPSKYVRQDNLRWYKWRLKILKGLCLSQCLTGKLNWHSKTMISCMLLFRAWLK